jgi:hypothetical protein
VQRVRFGDAEPTAKSIRRFVTAARLLTNDPSIKANDLFPLDDDDGPQSTAQAGESPMPLDVPTDSQFRPPHSDGVPAMRPLE